MNFENIIESIGYKDDLGVSLSEELVNLCGDSIVPRSTTKIFGDSGIGNKYKESREGRKRTVSDENGEKTSNDFIKTLKKFVHSSQDLIVRLKKLGVEVDERKIELLYGMLSQLSEWKEWPVAIIPKFWNRYKTQLTQEEFDKRKQDVIKKYAESEYKKTWIDKVKKLNFSCWNTRSWMLFDFYIPDLKVRIELDGSQHNDFPQYEIDQTSDKYFEEIYGIKTFRFTGFGGMHYNALTDYEKNKSSIDEFLVFLYQRLEEIEELGNGKRDIREDGAYMSICWAWWRSEGLRRCIYPDDSFSRPDMKIGKIESPENLIYEERAE